MVYGICHPASTVGVGPTGFFRSAPGALRAAQEDDIALADFRVALFSNPPEITWVWPELLRSGISMACVVSIYPRLLRHDLLDSVKEEAQKRGIPFFRPADPSGPEFVSEFFKTDPSVVASVGFPRKIPAEILSRVPHGGINCHPAFLPHYRGSSPCFWPVFNQDRESGVTIHQMTDEFDAGDIHFRKKIPLEPEETSGSLTLRCLREGTKLLLLALRELNEGRKLLRMAQDPAQVTRAPYPPAAVLQIRWDRPAEKILALIRAGSPFYGAFTAWGSQRLIVWSAQLSRPNSENLPPGALVVSRGKTEVAAGDALLSLETVQQGFARYYSGQELLRLPGIRGRIVLGAPVS